MTNKESEREHAEADSMGKEMTARKEGCLRGLHRRESERESEGGRMETVGEPSSRRCSPGLKDWLLLSCFHSFALSLFVSRLQIKFNSSLFDLTVLMSLSCP